jgi:hypothetical protein
MLSRTARAEALRVALPEAKGISVAVAVAAPAVAGDVGARSHRSSARRAAAASRLLAQAPAQQIAASIAIAAIAAIAGHAATERNPL